MDYIDFTDWLEENTPEGIEPDDFVAYLASRTADIINIGAEKHKITPKQFINRWFQSCLEDGFYSH